MSPVTKKISSVYVDLSVYQVVLYAKNSYFFEHISSYEHFFFAPNAKQSTREARPDTSVEVRARSVPPSGARGKPSRCVCVFFFFGGGGGSG